MAVAFESVLAPPTTSVSTNPIARTHVAGTGGSSGYLFVIVHARAASAALTCTIGGNPATQIGFATASASSVYIFGLGVGTVANAQNIAVSVGNAGTVACRVGSILYLNADQFSTPTTVSNNSGTTSPQSSTALSGRATDMALSAYSVSAASAATATLAAGTGTLTQRWSSSGGTGGSAMGEGAYEAALTAQSSTQFAWTASTTSHAIVTVDLASLGINKSEAVTTTDTPGAAIPTGATADSVNATESVAVTTPYFPVSRSDAVAATESVVVAVMPVDLAINKSETITVTESTTVIFSTGQNIIVSESVDVTEESGPHNYCPNPSFEYDTVGSPPALWSTAADAVLGAGAIATVVADSFTGSQCCELVTDGVHPFEGMGIVVTPPGGFKRGCRYIIRVAARLIAGSSPSVRMAIAGATGAASFTTTTLWSSAGVLGAFTPASDVASATAYISTFGSVAATIRVDAILVARSDAGTFVNYPYGDGDSGEWWWEGTPGQSVSRGPGVTGLSTVDLSPQISESVTVTSTAGSISGDKNITVSESVDVIEESGPHNYCPNPSFEQDAPGGAPALWSTTVASSVAVGAVATVINTDSFGGSQCCQLVGDGARVSEGMWITIAPPDGFKRGLTYVFQFHVKLIAGSAGMNFVLGTVSSAGTANANWSAGGGGISNSPVRLSWTPIVDTPTTTAQISCSSSATFTWLIDAVTVFRDSIGWPSASVLPYGDGDFGEWSWDGTAGQSVSHGPGLLLDPGSGVTLSPLPVAEFMRVADSVTVSGDKNITVSEAVAVIEEIGPYNYCPNPSFEHDTVGSPLPADWSTTSFQVAAIVTNVDPFSGSQCVQLRSNAPFNGGAFVGMTITIAPPGGFRKGATYAFSGMTKVIFGPSVGWRCSIQVFALAGVPYTPTPYWSLSPIVTWTPTVDTPTTTLSFKSFDVGPYVLLVDAVTCVRTDTGVPAYGDGDYALWSWDGTPGNSISHGTGNMGIATDTTLFALPVSDVVSPTESVARTLQTDINESETLTLAEALAVILSGVSGDLAVVLADAISLADTSTLELLISLVASADTITLSDIAAELVESNATGSETVSVAESIGRTLADNASVSDAVAGSEALAELVTSFIAASDSPTTVDTPALTDVWNASTSDASTVSEVVTDLLVSFIAATDAASMSEAVAEVVSTALVVSDAVTVSESVINGLGVLLAVSDAITTSESTLELLLSFVAKLESIAVAEAAALTLVDNAAVSDAAAVSESVLELLVSFAAVSDAAATAESVQAALLTAITASDAASVAEAVVAALGTTLSVTDAVAVSEALSEQLVSFITATAAVTTSDSPALTDVWNAAVSDAAAVAESAAGLLVSFAAATDAVSSAESAQAAVLMALAVSDAVSVTEALAAAVGVLLTVSDASAITEATAEQLVSFASASDAATVAESVTELLTSFIAAQDAVAVTESDLVIVTLVGVLVVASSEAVSVAEAASELLLAFASVSDAAAAADIPAALLESLLTVSQSITTADTPATTSVFNTAVSDAAGAADSTAEQLVSFIAQTDPAAVAETVAASLGITATSTESVSVTEALSEVLSTTVTAVDAAAVADAPAAELLSFIAGLELVASAEGPAETLVHNTAVADAVSLSEALAELAVANAAVTDAVSAAEATARLLQSFLAVSDSVAVSESLLAIVSVVGAVVLAVSEAVAVSEAAAELVSSFIAAQDTATVTEAAAASFAMFLTAADAVGVAEAVSSSVATFLAAADAVTAAESAAATLLTAATASESVAVADAAAALLVAFATVSDTVTAAEVTAAQVLVAVAASDQVPVSEQLAAALELRISTIDPVALSEALAVTLPTALALLAAVADTAGVADSPAASVTVSAAATDTAAVSDAPAAREVSFILAADQLAADDATALTLVYTAAVSDTTFVAEQGAVAPPVAFVAVFDAVTAADRGGVDRSAHRARVTIADSTTGVITATGPTARVTLTDGVGTYLVAGDHPRTRASTGDEPGTSASLSS